MLKLTYLCQHDWRRIASGEYQCRVCGAITDEPDV